MQTTLQQLQDYLTQLQRQLELAEYCKAHTLTPTIQQTDFQDNHIAQLRKQINSTQYTIEVHQLQKITTEHALDMLQVKYQVKGLQYFITA